MENCGWDLLRNSWLAGMSEAFFPRLILNDGCYLDENLVHLVSNIQENSFFFQTPSLL